MLRNLSKTITKLKSRRLWLGFYLAPTIAAFSIAVVMLPGPRPQGIDSIANSSADVVIGQPDMTSNLINQIAYSGTMSAPWSIHSDGTKMFVADTHNHRVLIYNTIPSTSNARADVVVGQPDFVTVSSGAAADKMNYPAGLYSDGTRLYVADTYNHRVLIYNTIPTANNSAADIVIGQQDFTSNTANQGMSLPGPNTLSYPFGVYSNGTKLFVSDYSNHRVLVYNISSLPATNGSADLVIGQPVFTSNTANQGLGGARPQTLNSPYGVSGSGDKLFIADQVNNRVLIYNAVPSANNASADAAVGQASLFLNTGGTSQNSLKYPAAVWSSGGKMFIADRLNNRVMIYNTVPSTSGAFSDAVIGQTDYTSGSSTEAATAGNLANPAGVYSDGAQLFISDTGHNRILAYSSIPSSGCGALANSVFGQPDMTSNSANQTASAISGYAVYAPTGVFKYGSKLFISDQNNNRVLIYNRVPSDNNVLPDLVIGQPDMTTNEANNGGLSARTLKQPRAVFYDGTHLVIPDYGNHRVLIYNGLPANNYAAADVVIGQPDMTSNTANNGGVSGKSLRQPIAAFIYGDKLLISDNYNSRVLIFNTIPISNFTEADTVIGQPDMTSNTGNNGGVSARSLLHMSRIFASDNKLFVSDYENNRVLVYNNIPTSDFAAADTVIGQSDMSSNSANQGGAVSASTLSRPVGLWVEGSRLYVADQHNNRILVYNAVPSSNNAAADVVIGQPDMTSSSVNQGYSISSRTLYYPTGLYCESEKLYVSDYNNNRVLIYNLNTTKPVISDVKINEAGVVSGDTINSIPTLKAKLSGTDTVGGVYIDNLKITLGSTLYTYASFDASTDSYNSTTGVFTFKVKNELVPGKYDLKIEVSDYLGNWATYEATDLEVRAGSEAEIIGTPLNYPNPFNTTAGTTKITYNLTVDSNILVYIFDVRGALVWKRSYLTGSMGGKAGYNEVEWDGKDDFGSTVGNGIYPFRIVAGTKVLGRGKIAVLD